MRLRDRLDPDRLQPRDAGDAGGNDADALRDAGEAFLTAADDAIDRALSRDSTEFLHQNVQQGGQ
jgi:hypothetical protein